MKLIKLFWHGAPLEHIYPNAHWFQKWVLFKTRKFVRKTFILGAIAALMASSGTVGAILFSSSTVTATTPEVRIVEKELALPVLDRIADCESGNGGKPGTATHYKNGQVLLKANTNGTIDIGKYQVNLTYWGKKASDLGYDLTKEEDNKAMALWIYTNKGTTDWSASQKCWYK